MESGANLPPATADKTPFDRVADYCSERGYVGCEELLISDARRELATANAKLEAETVRANAAEHSLSIAQDMYDTEREARMAWEHTFGCTSPDTASHDWQARLETEITAKLAERTCAEQLAVRILGQEEYDNSPCQAHPLQLVELRFESERKAQEELKRNYMELILSVAQKFPGATRHQTALRYIRSREIESNRAEAVLAKEQPHD